MLLLMTAIGSPDLDSPAVAREGSPDLGCPNLGRFDHRQQEREKAVLSLADQIAIVKSIKILLLVRHFVQYNPHQLILPPFSCPNNGQ